MPMSRGMQCGCVGPNVTAVIRNALVRALTEGGYTAGQGNVAGQTRPSACKARVALTRMLHSTLMNIHGTHMNATPALWPSASVTSRSRLMWPAQQEKGANNMSTHAHARVRAGKPATAQE